MTLALEPIPAPANRKMTIEEFDRLPDRKRYELVHGNRVERNVGTESDLIGKAITFVLELYSRRSNVGIAFGETDYALDPEDRHHFRRPEASFVLRSRFPGARIPVGRMKFAPDLAVEVVSPHDLAADIDDKLVEYMQRGVSLVWIVYPKSRTVHAYRPGHHPEVFEYSSEITGHEVLPGFTAKVSDFFPNLDLTESSPPAQNPQ